MFLQNFGIFSKKYGILKIATSSPLKLLTYCEIPAKIRENIGEKSHILGDFNRILQKFSKIPTKFATFWKRKYVNFESGAVQRFVNLEDLEKCCKMRIWLQRLASIQKRTSLPKFQAGGEFHLEFHIRTPPPICSNAYPAASEIPKALCAIQR